MSVHQSADSFTIPQELKERDQWVVWRYETRDGKETKVLYIPQRSLRRADSTDPKTWRSYQTAVDALESGKYAGVGFVFSEDDPYTGVDLDDIRDADTGDLHPRAREILGTLDGHSEVSPSGTGIHIYVKGSLPGPPHSHNYEDGTKVEAYSKGRFFTVTGNAEVVRDIPERHLALATVHEKFIAAPKRRPSEAADPTANGKPPSGVGSPASDEKILAKIRKAKNAPKFERLWAGDISDYHGDHSSADLAFLSMLTFYTQDPEQLERLHNGSGLAREKSTNRPDYVERTIAKALEGAGEVYEWERRRTQNNSNDTNDSDLTGAKKEGNQAKRLIGYAMNAADELFLDQNGAEHALVNGAPVPLDRGCYGWLRRLFWEHEEAAATTDLLGTTAGQLRAFAEISGNEHTLHLRAAEYEGAVYLYLGPGRVVRVVADGWELDPEPPVMFRPVLNLKDLPDPERGGTLDDLDIFITAKDPRDHRLAKAWLVLALLADTNRPILLAHGPQGATKSSVQRVLKNIIDPAKPTTLKLREKDFEQNINKAFIPFFDNVSNITDYMADELSKAVTGAGNAVRKLYEDDSDIIREYRRAMLLNGLVIPTEKADLIDRILPVALKRVEKKSRETEKRMQALFDERHPKLLGAVLSALSGALANHEEIRGRELPRMADWAEYAIALYEHLGWYDGGTTGYEGFWADWAVIEEGQHAVTLEGSAVAQAVVAVMKAHGPLVQRSPAKMLELLHDAAESEGLNPDKDKEFPKQASWLWRKIVPVIPTLESFGITTTSGKDESKTRYIRFEKDATPNPEPEGEGQHNASGDSKEKMLSPSDPHTYAKGTAVTAESPYLPGNSKYPTNRVDKTPDKDGLLFSGKNADSADSAVTSAYLSGGEGDSKKEMLSPEGNMLSPSAGAVERIAAEHGITKPQARAVANLSPDERAEYDALRAGGKQHVGALKAARDPGWEDIPE